MRLTSGSRSAVLRLIHDLRHYCMYASRECSGKNAGSRLAKVSTIHACDKNQNLMNWLFHIKWPLIGVFSVCKDKMIFREREYKENAIYTICEISVKVGLFQS